MEVKKHILARWDEFWRQGLFTDGFYTAQDKQVRVHKLVLAQSSLFFARAFHLVHDEEIPVVLDIANKFDDIVKMVYTGHAAISASNPSEVFGLYALAAFYGMNDILVMLKDVITIEILNNENLKDDKEAVFEWLACFRAAESSIKEYPGLEQVIHEARQWLSESQVILVDRIVADFAGIDSAGFERVCQTAPPFLFAKIVEHSNLSPEQTVVLLDKCTSCADQHESLQYFESLVDWEAPGSYRLFTKAKLDWVDPAIARRGLGDVLTARRISMRAMEREVLRIRKNKSVRSVVRWVPFQWCTEIESATAVEALPDVRLFDFLGTIGGLVKSVDIAKFGFVDSSCSSWLGSERDRRFSTDVLFNSAEQSESRYFVSDPLDAPRDFHFTLSFHQFRFVVRQVQLFFYPKHRVEENGSFVCAGMNRKSVAWQVSSQASGSRESPVVEFVQESSNTPVSSIKIMLSERMWNIQYPLVLRAGRIEAKGRFVP